ncbi:hypothetical protein GJAV_G00221120 [Gymnothorax javanicus]|nr:hypothetical protein GJAV_G00221120 [Gymnothorax javanicus]
MVSRMTFNTYSSLPAPSLSLLPPSSEELKTGKATLVCLTQMSVGFADVSWTSVASQSRRPYLIHCLKSCRSVLPTTVVQQFHG